MTITKKVKVNTEVIENLKTLFILKHGKAVSEVKSSYKMDEITLRYVNKYFIERVKETFQDKLVAQLANTPLVKEVFTSAVLIAIMQLVIYAIMMSFGILPPAFADTVLLKIVVYGVISIAGYYFRKALFQKKGDFYRGLLTAFFFSSLYQTNGWLIF